MLQNTALKPIYTTTAIGTAPVTLYTAPANTYAVISYCIFSNVSGPVNVNLTLYRVPFGGSAGTGNIVLPSYPLYAADPTLVGYFDRKITLAPGDFLVAVATVAASVNFNGCVLEYQLVT